MCVGCLPQQVLLIEEQIKSAQEKKASKSKSILTLRSDRRNYKNKLFLLCLTKIIIRSTALLKAKTLMRQFINFLIKNVNPHTPFLVLKAIEYMLLHETVYP